MTLEKETAQQFLAHPENPNPFQFYNRITDEAAELLGSYQGNKLDLGWLRELTQTAAAYLGAFKGDLILDALKDPSPAVIEELAERSWKEGQYLSLDGIKTLDKQQAQALSAYRGKLGLRGLLEISDACAEILGSGSCFHLYLDGIRSITDSALKNILGKPNVICLNGLEKLPALGGDELWENIEYSPVGEIYLNGLKSTSADSLNKVASATEEHLYLNNLEFLPQDPDLFKNHGCAISLDGLRKISDLDSVNLGVNLADFSLSLAGLEELSVRQAELLVGSERGDFCLGLRNVSDEVANAIFRTKSSTLVMNNLEELSAFAAEICGRFIHSEWVSFDGLKQISDDAFDLLMSDYTGEGDWCPGHISLGGLNHLTPRMSKALAETKHDVSLAGVKDKI